MKTHAAVLWGREQDWQIEEIDLDPPRSQEVLVKWAAAGLCHSDEHLRRSDMGASGPPKHAARPPAVPDGGRPRGRRRRARSRSGRARCRGGRPRGGELLPDLRPLQNVHHRALQPLRPGCGDLLPGQISDGTVRYHLKGGT